MKSLNLCSLDELQTALHRIDHHRRTVNELGVERRDIVEEMNSRVSMIRCPYIQRYNGDGSVPATRSFFQ